MDNNKKWEKEEMQRKGRMVDEWVLSFLVKFNVLELEMYNKSLWILWENQQL